MIFDEVEFDGSELFDATGQINDLSAVWFFFIDADDCVADQEHFWRSQDKLKEVWNLDVFIFDQCRRNEAHAHGVHCRENYIQAGRF